MQGDGAGGDNGMGGEFGRSIFWNMMVNYSHCLRRTVGELAALMYSSLSNVRLLPSWS